MIDIHQHVNWQGKQDKDLINYLDRTGISRCWLLSWESIDGGRELSYQHLSIHDIIKTHKKHPNRIVPFCGIDPRRENAVEHLQSLHKKGFRGYGECKWAILADNPYLIRMLKACGRLKMPALLHLDVDIPATPQWYLGDITHLENAARLCPNTKIIGHGPGFWREISGNAPRVNKLYPSGRVMPGGRLWKALAGHPNLYADLSANSCLTALKRDLRYTRKLIKRFRKKLLYGTDSYNTHLLEFLKTLNLPKDIFQDITFNNAKRLIP